MQIYSFDTAAVTIDVTDGVKELKVSRKTRKADEGLKDMAAES